MSLTSMFTFNLFSPEVNLTRAGGKAASLTRLGRAGFPVPPGFVVTTEAYRHFLRVHGLESQVMDLARRAASDDAAGLEAISSEIRQLFSQAPIPADLAGSIDFAYAGLWQGQSAPEKTPDQPRGAAVAVRSSATAEDLPDLSFAGQQESALNVVGVEMLLKAVNRCWSSLWTARALAYRCRNQVPHDQVALAVVVQAMVTAESSGMLFTANPLTGHRGEMVIQASLGLGEAIVSGQVESDEYVLDAAASQITRRKVGGKAVRTLPLAGGGTEQRVFEAERQPALPDTAVLELARLGGLAAALFGQPQDIEWARSREKIYLLQSRPITTLYPLPQVTRPHEGLRIYFNVNSPQGVTAPFTPLGRDAIRMIGAGPLARLERPVEDFLPDAGGRLFIDITAILGDPRLSSHLPRFFLKMDAGAGKTIVQLIESGRFEKRKTFTWHTLDSLLPALIPIFARACLSAVAPKLMRTRAVREAEEFLGRARVHAAGAHSLDARLDAFEQDLGHVFEGIMAPLMSVILPGFVSMALADHWLGRWLGLEAGGVLPLTRGLPGNVTTEMNLKLWALSEKIRAVPEARHRLVREPVESLAEAYYQGRLPSPAQEGLAEFLRQYGMRGVAEIDFGHARWREDPSAVLATLAGYLKWEEGRAGPDRMFQEHSEEAGRQAEQLIERVRQTTWGAARAPLLAWAIRRMRQLTGLRESPKFFLIQLFGIYRTALLESGTRLAKQGELEKAEDIFYVPMKTLRQFAQGEKVDLKGMAAREREAYQRELRRQRIPRILLSTGEVFYEGIHETKSGDLVGEGVSPGIAEGSVRVVTHPAGARLEPGEILVCPATDPGWTPLFLTAGGLVTELGGLLTHGSVVARELGIPAVVGVHDATQRLRTGQKIRLDGSQGRITIL